VDLDATVIPFVDANVLARERQRLGARLDEVGHALEVERQVAGQRPLLLPGEDEPEVLVVAKRAMSVVRVLGGAPEPAVVVRHELRHEGVPGVHGGDIAQAKLLHEPVLSVWFIRSTRPFACGEFAQMISMLRSARARPNCVTPLPGPPTREKRKPNGRRDLRKLPLEEERVEIRDEIFEKLVGEGKPFIKDQSAAMPRAGQA
jgi:hypothetical protein